MKKLSIAALGVELGQQMPNERVLAIAQPEANLDAGAFRAFYEETSRPLFAYLLRVCGGRALAEDLLQESYCRFLTAKFTAKDPAHMRNYLFRIATNLMRDHWRHHRIRREEPLDAAEPEVAASVEDPAVSVEIRRALACLNPRERQMLWLAYVEGSSHKEIADSMGARAKSIRVLLFRTRRKLASLIRANATHRNDR